MIDPTTGMKAGQRYSVENVERAHQFTGFFLDGKYYLGPELLTAVGWVEGKRFIYDNLDAAGEPVFPDRVAGEVEDLTLTLVDGTALKLFRVEVSAMPEDVEAADRVQADAAQDHEPSDVKPGEKSLAPTVTQRWLADGGLTRKDKIPLLVSAAVIGFVTGLIITHTQRRRR